MLCVCVCGGGCQESAEAAELVNSAGVCILVDLVGYTSDHRQDVLALRPAPLQVYIERETCVYLYIHRCIDISSWLRQ